MAMVKFKPADAEFFGMFSALSAHLLSQSGLVAEMLADNADVDDIVARATLATETADDMTRAIITKTALSFVTPYDREDMYALSSGLGSVMARLDEAVDLMSLYDVKAYPPEMFAQIELVQRCAEVTAEAMPSLRSLQGITEYCTTLDRLRRTSDRHHRRIQARLFGGDYKALEVLKIRDVVGAIKGAVDAFAHVAAVVERIALKES